MTHTTIGRIEDVCFTTKKAVENSSSRRSAMKFLTFLSAVLCLVCFTTTEAFSATVTRPSVTVTQTAGGKITPAGKTLVNNGGNLTFSFNPLAGNLVESVTINGVKIFNGVVSTDPKLTRDGKSLNYKYMLKGITKNFTVTATFIKNVKVVWYQDGDRDGYYGATAMAVFQPTITFVRSAIYGDCNDGNANINPVAKEVCGNGIDENCDGKDDVCPVYAWYKDADGDGFHSGAVIMNYLQPSAGYVRTATAGDCNDADAMSFPGAIEIPNNGVDEDCDGVDAIIVIGDDGSRKFLDPLPQTGQRVSALVGDDGDLQKGVEWTDETRFTKNDDGTVTDNVTGLMWLGDGACLGKGGWSWALNKVNGLNTGASTCATLTATYTDWRMPNLRELALLLNADKADQMGWMMSVGFTGMTTTNTTYWSSTSAPNGKGYNIWISGIGMMTSIAAKTKLSNTFAVRGTSDIIQTGQRISYAANDDGAIQAGIPWAGDTRFEDQADGDVVDTMTGLEFNKNLVCNVNYLLSPSTLTSLTTWEEAVAYVNGLNAGLYPLCDNGHHDWRLPNVYEAYSLLDFGKNQGTSFLFAGVSETFVINPALALVEGNVAPVVDSYLADAPASFWTSTTVAATPDKVYVVGNITGGYAPIYKYFVNGVTPVRDAK